MISEQDCITEHDEPLTQTHRVLLSVPSQQKLDICGQVVGNLSNQFQTTEQEVYVVCSLHKALLGQPTIEALQTVKQVEPVQPIQLSNNFQSFFKDSGD